jgi:hypothetical protein
MTTPQGLPETQKIIQEITDNANAVGARFRESVRTGQLKRAKKDDMDFYSHTWTADEVKEKLKNKMRNIRGESVCATTPADGPWA